MFEVPPENQPAVLASAVEIPRDADWIGGLSGIEVSQDGTGFHIITDKGHLARGIFERDQDTMNRIVFQDVRRLVPDDGIERDIPIDDAEGLARDALGRLFVSFEHEHRVVVYDTWDAAGVLPGYTHAWRALANNKGLEALAITDGGTLLTLPEQVNTGADQALLYTRAKGGTWQQYLTLPVEEDYKPVGADMGPDGRLYLLERQFTMLGFRSRVRAISVQSGSFGETETLLQTAWGDHGNLEGISIWTDRDGKTRLTMVSDDNFLPFMRGEIIEYVLADRVAQTPQ